MAVLEDIKLTNTLMTVSWL